MLQASITNSTHELEDILQLQHDNLQQNLDQKEIQSQGFVTLRHDIQTLQQMHEIAPSVIIKDTDRVVAYALTMFRECRQLIPDLEPMFASLDNVSWKNKPLHSYRFYVMGQVCIAKAYRGQGLFEQLYLHHKKVYQPRFELFVTEISIRNPRSIRAHEKIGFKTIHIHHHRLDEWAVVAWDWT